MAAILPERGRWSAKGTATSPPRPSRSGPPSSGEAVGEGSQYESAHSFREKLRDELDGRLGIFFHDPVPGIWNDAAGDIGGDEAQIIRHRRTEGFLRTNNEHQHRDLATLDEQHLIVNRVLAECTELLERVVHSMRPSVQFGVMTADLFVDFLRVRRQFV